MPTTQITKTATSKNLGQGKTVLPDTIKPILVDGYLQDPRKSYIFSAPGIAPRVITGEGTKVMLAHAHPGASFDLLVDPFEDLSGIDADGAEAIIEMLGGAPITDDISETTFEPPTPEDFEKALDEAIEIDLTETFEPEMDSNGFSREDLNAMTRDEVRAYAKQIDLPNFSKVRSSKATLIEAILAHQEAQG